MRPVTGLEINIAEQELRFARAFEVLRDGIAERAFPGAVVSVLHRGEVIALQGFGHFTYDPTSPVVTADTIFDLASVTKVLATTSMAMILYQHGKLDLNAPVVSLAPEFDTGDLRRHKVTVHMLLAHSSGLPAYAKLWETAGPEARMTSSRRQEIIRAAMRLPLEADPGTRAAYSDIGFIILGEILERIAGERLDTFCAREICSPLMMERTLFCPPDGLCDSIPPTEDDRTRRRRVVQGEVQDENAWAMGGVAGHAGVFANAADVARFACCMLTGGAPIVKRETVELFTRRESSPPGTSRALGWDTPSQPSQSGQYFSPQSFGHLGYAGTSLWIDPGRELAVALLTNRTWPDRKAQGIKRVRPKFHDAVVEALR